jgi:hypothetical protein
MGEGVSRTARLFDGVTAAAPSETHNPPSAQGERGEAGLMPCLTLSFSMCLLEQTERRLGRTVGLRQHGCAGLDEGVPACKLG